MRLSQPMADLLDALVQMREIAPDRPGLLLLGAQYRTAEALERRGWVALRYQGPGQCGWAKLTDAGARRFA